MMRWEWIHATEDGTPHGEDGEKKKSGKSAAIEQERSTHWNERGGETSLLSPSS